MFFNDPLHDGKITICNFLCKEIIHRFADQVWIIPDADTGWVGIEDLSIQVQHGNGTIRGLCQITVILFTDPQGFFCLFTLGDIEHETFQE